MLSAPATGDGRPLAADEKKRPGVAHTCVPDTMDTPIMPPEVGEFPGKLVHDQIMTRVEPITSVGAENWMVP